MSSESDPSMNLPQSLTDSSSENYIDDFDFDFEDDDHGEAELILSFWLKEFAGSEYFDPLSETAKDEAEFIIRAFAQYMYSWQYELPNKWTVSSLETVCLEALPSKVSADDSTFECVSPVLVQFFNFLSSREYHLEADKLSARVEYLHDGIVERARDPRNWGMAKSAHMSGLGASDLNKIWRDVLSQERRELEALVLLQNRRAKNLKKRKAQRAARKKNRKR